VGILYPPKGDERLARGLTFIIFHYCTYKFWCSNLESTRTKMYFRNAGNVFMEPCEHRGFITWEGIVGYMESVIGSYVVVVRDPCSRRVFGKLDADQSLPQQEGFLLRRFNHSVCFLRSRKFQKGTPAFQTPVIPSWTRDTMLVEIQELDDVWTKRTEMYWFDRAILSEHFANLLRAGPPVQICNPQNRTILSIGWLRCVLCLPRRGFLDTSRGVRLVCYWELFFLETSTRQKECSLSGYNSVSIALPTRWVKDTGEECKTCLLAKKVAKHGKGKMLC